MNVFFELHQSVRYLDQDGRYFAAYGHTGDKLGRFNELLRASERVWIEGENGHVQYLKNRHSSLDCSQTHVDPKEFMWIKLKSQTV